jgi:hypothetical protein
LNPPNNEVERRGIALKANETDLSQSSTPSLDTEDATAIARTIVGQQSGNSINARFVAHEAARSARVQLRIAAMPRRPS